jgi:WD40 repeat protein
MNDEYKHYKQLPPALVSQQVPVGPARPKEMRKAITAGPSSSETSRMIASIDTTPEQRVSSFTNSSKLSQALTLHKTTRTVKPTYHAPWKLMRVISGHLGWVRSVAVEPGNKWFATGAGDRVIKIWNLASGELRLSLTGHISTVRGLAVSPRHPYLFSCGEDKVHFFGALCRLRPTFLMSSDLDGKMLGSRGQQGYSTLPWPSFRCLLSQPPSNPRCACHSRSRRVSARLGHADQGANTRPFWTHRNCRRCQVPGIGPSGDHGQHGFHCSVSKGHAVPHFVLAV